jgi:hypothetical protein
MAMAHVARAHVAAEANAIAQRNGPVAADRARSALSTFRLGNREGIVCGVVRKLKEGPPNGVCFRGSAERPYDPEESEVIPR